MKRLNVLVVMLFVAGISLKAQDTLRLLNGNTLYVKIGEINENTISFLRLDKAKKSFSERDKTDLFSYTREGGKEIFVYEYAPERGNIYEVKEMKMYMLGENEASDHYKSKVSNYFSFGAGAFAGYYLAQDKLFPIAAPLVISSVVLIPGVSVKKNEMNEAYRKTGPYRDGYKRAAKGRKFLSSFKYSAMGMLGSFVYFRFID